MYIREAMEEAGKPFGKMNPEQISAALRKYEIARSHRVAHIVGKSGKIGSMFMLMGYLVSACQKLCTGRVLSKDVSCHSYATTLMFVVRSAGSLRDFACQAFVQQMQSRVCPIKCYLLGHASPLGYKGAMESARHPFLKSLMC